MTRVDQVTEVAAWVDGRPVPVSAVDDAERALRGGRAASALPSPGTSEGRQLRRWLVQVLSADLLVRSEAERRGLSADDAPPLAQLAPARHHLLELGSAAAALLARNALARAVFVAVTAAVDVPEAEVVAYRARNHDVPGSTSEERVRSHLLGAARRRAFVEWLDVERAHRVRLAPGYEHPGDPRQPDNTHRH
ncbi:[acyl-carrier-protein] S-malonyltransferase [Streptoalloteichus tenebrarius]|uniref:[acyl-carrier-protein] S-malonyltransferase n=1 Tax=Streptoalloteichus tenebrarius (strain ATCC 17920 / DSM 40477 / JCM 4838 / CBS 697.72 / NBRC 16177 / NCIMB 11028 / NRRL B-12390 / A12253. 1 / ISP 5477) TaxID=1933 RepID=A0ABT1I2G2_STRSD|nr:hypothetical protein [Streptoalloteichus tenebrarius]MCP2261923.1 [acyl-carrier-protein] S-malonyltransferase [Streptoalloteichus tenebrarius]BFF02085.1 malonyl CoA-ACP transacylase [Streptoalloteichus tenebrarius]